MRRIVLIDGENLIYGLRHLLGVNNNKADRSILDSFDFRGLTEEMLSDNMPNRILWFGARLRMYNQTEDLKIKSESAIRLQSKFMNHIQSQNIQFIKVGYLRARESAPCDSCGNKQWKLAEKGVDVGLAVRMVTEADAKTEIAVISADTDLLPAFTAASKAGAKLMHISYEHRPIAALSRAADVTRTITLPLATKYNNLKK